MPELIIFDCDGVLIDSEIIGCREEAKALNEAGIKITEKEVVKRFTGMQTSVLRKILEKEQGIKLADDFEQKVMAKTVKAFEEDLVAIPKVEETLKKLDCPICIASGSSPERLKMTLEKTGLYSFFAPNIFSANMVPNGKPAPDLFLLCAMKMYASPVRCVVVEDSVAGVKGAVAAGMHVLGFTGGSHCDKNHAKMLKDAGAKRTFSDMSKLLKIIKEEWL